MHFTLEILCTAGIETEFSLHSIDQRETAPPAYQLFTEQGTFSFHAQDRQILLETITIFGFAWFLKQGEICKLKLPTLSLSLPHNPSQTLPRSRANNNLSPNRTGFTTASCFSSTSCSCSPPPDSPPAPASPVSRYPQTCSWAAPRVTPFGGLVFT